MSSAEKPDRDAAPDWIDTPTAAALLGVSERAVQRRCKAGKIAARRVPTPTGQQWQIERAALIKASRGDDSPNTNDSNDTQNGEVTTLTTQETTETTLKAPTLPTLPTAQTPEATTPTTAPTQSADTNLTAFQLEVARRDVDAKAEEIRFLRGLVEQRDRDAAELRAALREALKAMPRQLTSGIPEAPPIAPEVPRTPANCADEPKHAAPSNGPQIVPERGEVPISYGDIANWLEKEMEQ